MTQSPPVIAVTPGEPAGIGPDLLLETARRGHSFNLVAIADAEMLKRRAAELNVAVDIVDASETADGRRVSSNTLRVQHVPLAAREVSGRLDASNANYVLTTVRKATTGCVNGEYDALVTGPVHKGVINDAGFSFTGHTEFIADLTGASRPVMMLVADTLRVALVTTHLPLRDVPDAITGDAIVTAAQIVCTDLRTRFGLESPRLIVLGLNPHAGEGGHLGTEDHAVIEPAVTELRTQGLYIDGPLPADTAFVPSHLERADAVLAMYHDQGLPVLKHRGFGHAVNITLGLPIIRTSVDHGTALDLAGRGTADAGSLHAALALADDIARRCASPTG